MCKDHDDLKKLPHRLTCFWNGLKRSSTHRHTGSYRIIPDHTGSYRIIPDHTGMMTDLEIGQAHFCFLKSDHLWCHETWRNHRTLSGGFPEGFFLISHLGAILIQKRTFFVAMYDRI